MLISNGYNFGCFCFHCKSFSFFINQCSVSWVVKLLLECYSMNNRFFTQNTQSKVIDFLLSERHLFKFYIQCNDSMVT